MPLVMQSVSSTSQLTSGQSWKERKTLQQAVVSKQFGFE